MKIRRTDQLPRWFDLSRYERCRQYRADDWRTALWLRNEALTGTTAQREWLLDVIAENPAQPPTSNVRPLCGPVRLLKWDDLDYLPRDQMRPDNPTPIGSLRTGFDVVFLAGIDLSATDSVLREAFNHFLKKARVVERQQGKTPKRERLPYESWAYWGLLPYLDLTIWESVTGNQITKTLMAEAVFSGEGANEQHIYRRLKPLADRLSELMDTLRGQATTELGNPEKFPLSKP